jgi:hypothetical protein
MLGVPQHGEKTACLFFFGVSINMDEIPHLRRRCFDLRAEASWKEAVV